MVIRNSVRYLMNRLMFGSECIYHEENCIIDHVTKRATDVNRIEKKSVLKLILSSIEFMVTQCQVVLEVEFRLPAFFFHLILGDLVLESNPTSNKIYRL